jgi:hypothetical protein
VSVRSRVLLGAGSTPWAALVDLAAQFNAERRRDDAVERASEDVQMRMMRVASTSSTPGSWIVEAKWMVG